MNKIYGAFLKLPDEGSYEINAVTRDFEIFKLQIQMKFAKLTQNVLTIFDGL